MHLSSACPVRRSPGQQGEYVGEYKGKWGEGGTLVKGQEKDGDLASTSTPPPPPTLYTSANNWNNAFKIWCVCRKHSTGTHIWWTTFITEILLTARHQNKMLLLQITNNFKKAYLDSLKDTVSYEFLYELKEHLLKVKPNMFSEFDFLIRWHNDYSVTITITRATWTNLTNWMTGK